jgi:hypothetical protein
MSNGRRIPMTAEAQIVREIEKARHDSVAHLWPYIDEMRRLEDGFTEQEKAVIARFLKAATEATHRHAERLVSPMSENANQVRR